MHTAKVALEHARRRINLEAEVTATKEAAHCKLALSALPKMLRLGKHTQELAVDSVL